MAVLEFECQLARSQISRYMGGEVLSSELLRQLGLHVAECGGCKSFLEERRVALRNMLESDIEARNQESEELVSAGRRPTKRPLAATAHNNQDQARSALTHAITDPAANLIAKLKEHQSADDQGSESNPKKILPSLQGFTRPAILSAILAVVLIGMSYFVKTPSNLFGPTALAASKQAVSVQQTSISNPPLASKKADFGPQVTLQKAASSNTVKSTKSKSIPITASPSNPANHKNLLALAHPTKLPANLKKISFHPKSASLRLVKAHRFHTRSRWSKARTRHRHSLQSGHGSVHLIQTL